MKFKKGVATVSVEREGAFVKKVFQTWNKYKRERDFYLTTGGALSFVPKLHRFEDETKTLWTEYSGQSLNLKYAPKDRYKFKPKIRELAASLAALNLYHNDIRWKNILESDNGDLFLIDFEVLSEVNKERDPEKILTEQPCKKDRRR